MAYAFEFYALIIARDWKVFKGGNNSITFNLPISRGQFLKLTLELLWSIATSVVKNVLAISLEIAAY